MTAGTLVCHTVSLFYLRVYTNVSGSDGSRKMYTGCQGGSMRGPATAEWPGGNGVNGSLWSSAAVHVHVCHRTQ